MLKKVSYLILILFLSSLSAFYAGTSPITENALKNSHLYSIQEKILSQKNLSLTNRWPNSWVNNIFKDNILLNLAYLRETVTPGRIDWNKVTQPFTYEFKLLPNQTFAFHQDVDKKYIGKVAKTTNAHFNFQEGFKSDGYLFGDGVCHLASILNWAAIDANLEVSAPTRHDFAKIADIPKEFGVSIYNQPGSTLSNAKQNLYITNNRPKPVVFRFDYANEQLKIALYEQI